MRDIRGQGFGVRGSRQDKFPMASDPEPPCETMKKSLAEIAELVGGEITGDIDKMISGAAPFEYAGNEDITFAANAKFLKKLAETQAGALIVPRSFVSERDVQDIFRNKAINIVAVDNPQTAFIRIVEIFYPVSKPESGIAPGACIGRKFICGKDISVGQGVVIGNHVTLGDRVILYPNTVIGNSVVIGNDVRIYPNVTILERCRIGNRVIIHAGTVIGSDGFGFAPEGTGYHKIPHIGIVQIDDDAEIGANNAIDRGTFGKTHICRGVKTDNLVHIAHNVTVGEDTVLVAQVGISGSVTIGKHAILAGQAGVSGHITIGDNATVGPQAGLAKSVPDGEIVSGSPGIPHKVWLRVQNIIPKLPEMKKKLAELEKKVNEVRGQG